MKYGSKKFLEMVAPPSEPGTPTHPPITERTARTTSGITMTIRLSWMPPCPCRVTVRVAWLKRVPNLMRLRRPAILPEESQKPQAEHIKRSQNAVNKPDRPVDQLA